MRELELPTVPTSSCALRDGEPGLGWGCRDAFSQAFAQLPVVSGLQGNGHERDFMDDKRVYIMDVYNRHIYPGDSFAKRELAPWEGALGTGGCQQFTMAAWGVLSRVPGGEVLGVEC